jgi:hypothetical protein
VTDNFFASGVIVVIISVSTSLFFAILLKDKNKPADTKDAAVEASATEYKMPYGGTMRIITLNTGERIAWCSSGSIAILPTNKETK